MQSCSVRTMRSEREMVAVHVVAQPNENSSLPMLMPSTPQQRQRLLQFGIAFSVVTPFINRAIRSDSLPSVS